MKIIKNFVNGKEQGTSKNTINVFDPSKGEPCAEVALSNENDFKSVIQSSIESQKQWEKFTPLKNCFPKKDNSFKSL